LSAPAGIIGGIFHDLTAWREGGGVASKNWTLLRVGEKNPQGLIEIV
jgi:hypothetical protein